MKKDKLDIKELKAAVVTHTFATGHAQHLEAYLRDKVPFLLFIGHPFSYAKDTRSFYHLYKDGNLIREHKSIDWPLPGILRYVKDTIYTFLWILLYSPKLHFYFAANNLNAFAGVWLRRLGKVERVLFYTIDYVPRRFDNWLVNEIYHAIDHFCVKNCDLVWNLSSAMVEGREKWGVSTKYRTKQVVVPTGTDISIGLSQPNNIDRNKMVFMGHLRPGQGVESLIRAMPGILKEVPKARLIIIGTGPLEEELKREVKKLGLEGHVEFTGYIEDYKDMLTCLAACSVAIAPYVDDEGTFTRYADPAKPRDYAGVGLPVVITKVPQVAWEIDKSGAGIAIDDDVAQLVSSVVSILRKDDTEYQALRENALNFARDYSWDNIFTKALRGLNISV